MTDKELSDFSDEVNLMMNIRPHVNVVTLLGVCAEPLSVVVEFLENGSLLSLIEKDKTTPFTDNFILSMIIGISRGMLHLHKENVVHRDLAARNVLLTLNYQPKISDFGMSRVAQEEEDANKTQTLSGPLKWMAPECITTQKYGFPSDVWSFAITIIEVLTRNKPFPQETNVSIATKVSTGKFLPSAPETSPEWIKSLIKCCCVFEPIDRLSFEQICAIAEKHEHFEEKKDENANISSPSTEYSEAPIKKEEMPIDYGTANKKSY